ncbi:uncharacterized protein LOC127851173 isoform X2 [Dreissena polymorpha]|uniref:Mab-21-like HhH/H2TH-like domain-containing protein n=2 Tax=Dreissena polymorpha TaxID=45954 RepID=A0A9D4CY66_DREPO|nr:uncharacterized protein LOC127851173 isoform X2 [Dreissena polymorpha]KAH3734744.1 hypothetical protein DPMN_041190 [Dreissena polymorpha]
MEPGVEFNSGDWDEKDGVSTMHLSYLLQTLLPLHTVKWDTTKRHYENIKSNLVCSMDETLDIIVSGSMSEGYSIPPYIVRTESIGTKPEVDVLSDVDTLWVSSRLKVSTKELSDFETSGYKAYFEYIENCPGYVRLCIPSPKENDETFVFDEQSEKYYLSGTKWTCKLFAALSKNDDVTQQGPAISMIDDLPAGDLFHVRDGISKDLVLALPCYPWPEVADAWKERVRESQWIRQEIIESIIKDGCHVVAVSSKQSKHPDLEWRLSFSASEGKFAREAVTDYQRQCFIYVKILHHQKIKPIGILSSYVFKSVFLHCCERLPVSHWKDYPGSCILYLLDVVLDCLKKKHVPTYFLPENNLIGHLNDADIDKVIASIESVRRDPITPILEFTDNRVFSHHCVYFTFREMVEPLLQDADEYKEHRNKEMSVLKGIVATCYRICFFLIAEKSTNPDVELFKHQHGIRCLIDVYTLWLKPMGLNATLVEYVDKAGLALTEPQSRLNFFIAVVSLEKHGYPEFADLKLRLARLYHRFACSEEVVLGRKMDFFAKAVLLYECVYKYDKGCIIDYSLALFEQKRLSEAQEILEKFVREHMEAEPFVQISFDISDKGCLVGQLKSYVESNGSITCDVLSFALYSLVFCLSSSDNSDSSQDLQAVVEKFEAYSNKRQDTNTQRLLNFAKSLAKEKKDHVTYFSAIYNSCFIL